MIGEHLSWAHAAIVLIGACYAVGGLMMYLLAATRRRKRRPKQWGRDHGDFADWKRTGAPKQ